VVLSEMNESAAMTAVADPVETVPPKASKMPLVSGLVLAIAGGGGGFFAVQKGLLGGSDTADVVQDNGHSDGHDSPSSPSLDFAFVALDPLVISLPRSGSRTHLRFAAQLEVDPAYVAEIEAVKPRIIDVLNGYLRAVDLTELEDPAALVRLRGQMLRRVQIVTGEGRVRDFLIMEFVLN
jgi:flagellar FliL protein